MKRAIAAVSLVVPDYDQAIAFYVDVMGFDLIADVDQGTRRWVQVAPKGGGASLVFGRAENAGQRAAIGHQSGGRVFLFLETDDFHRDHSAMISKGVHFEEKPREEPYGWVAVWCDPFGNRWDLLQRR